MTPEKSTFRLLTSNDISQIYELLRSEGYLTFLLAPEGKQKLDSIVGSITESYFGVEPYATSEEKAVAYLYFIINDHPFTDGNKRMAIIAFLTLCHLNGLRHDAALPLDALAVFVEKISKQEHQRAIARIAEEFFGMQA